MKFNPPKIKGNEKAYYMVCENCQTGFSFEKEKIHDIIKKHSQHMIKVGPALIHWPGVSDQQ